MNGEAPKTDTLEVAVQKPYAFIRVSGRGTFKNSSALKEFVVGALQGGCTRFVFDLAACTGMDSTFMGVMAGLALRLRSIPGGRLIALNLTDKTHALLCTLGLNVAVEMYRVGEAPSELAPLATSAPTLTTLATPPRTKEETAQTMLEAHEDLVRLSPENLPKFKDVLTYLRQDAGGKTDTQSS